MSLQTFPHLQDSTRLIKYQDTLYKVKILFTKMLQEKGVHNEELTEKRAHQEIEATFKAILYLFEHNSDFKTIATPNFCITPKLVPWAFPRKYKEYVFMQNGKVLKAFDQMFELHISEKFVKHNNDIDNTYSSINQSHVDKSSDMVKISSGGKKVISCPESKSNSGSAIEKADNMGKVYVQTVINLDNSGLEAMAKYERNKDGRLCRIISSNVLLNHSNETRPINNQVKSSINASFTERKGHFSKKCIVKPREENVSLSVKRVSELMNLSLKTPGLAKSKMRKHAVISNMNSVNYKLHEKYQSSYNLRERSTVSNFSTVSEYGSQQDIAVEPTSSNQMSELDKQAMTNIVSDQKKIQIENEVKNNPPRESKNYPRNNKRQKETAFNSDVKAQIMKRKAGRETVRNSVLKGKKNLLRKGLRVGLSTRSTRKTQHHRMTESNCNKNGQSLSSEREPRRKKIRLSQELSNHKSQESDIHTESEIDSSFSPRRNLKGQNCNRNNSAVTLRSSTLEDRTLNLRQKGLTNNKSQDSSIYTESELDSSSSRRRKLKGRNCNRNNSVVTLRSFTLEDRTLNSCQKGHINHKSQDSDIHTESKIDSSSSPRRNLRGGNCSRNNSTVSLSSSTLEDATLNSRRKGQEMCSPRISAVHPTKRAKTCMPNTDSVQDSTSRANNSNTPLISSARGDDAESLRIEQMRQHWPAHIIGVTSHGRDRYLVEQAEQAETDKLRQLYAPTMPRRSPRNTAKDHSTQRRGSLGLLGRIMDTFITPTKTLVN